MTDEPKRTQEEPGSTSDFPCCRDWSSKRADQAEGCDWAGMMSRIMEMCGAESDSDTPEEPGTPDTIV